MRDFAHQTWDDDLLSVVARHKHPGIESGYVLEGGRSGRPHGLETPGISPENGGNVSWIASYLFGRSKAANIGGRPRTSVPTDTDVVQQAKHSETEDLQRRRHEGLLEGEGGGTWFLRQYTAHEY
jgi:hypothetical protein